VQVLQAGNDEGDSLPRERRRTPVALTIDHGIWSDLPLEKVDWNTALLEPTERLFRLLQESAIHATFFVAMKQYLWLADHLPEIASRMGTQLQKAVGLGHDVQLYLHPMNGVRQSEATHLARSATDEKMADSIRGQKRALEDLLQPVAAGYRVECVRISPDQVQPFEPLSTALLSSGIPSDSSVLAGAVDPAKGWDFSHAYRRAEPYFADLLDPQLKAIPAEEKLLELPIFTYKGGRRWLIDGAGANRLANRLIKFERRALHHKSELPSSLKAKMRGVANVAYVKTGSLRRWVSRLIPRQMLYRLLLPAPHPALRRYYVMQGHVEGRFDCHALAAGFRRLREEMQAEFVTISELARLALDEFGSTRRTREAELDAQVADNAAGVMSELRNGGQSYRLQEMIPRDAADVLDFGCGAGYWSARIAALCPWMKVVGIDGGAPFIEKAIKQYGSDRVRFLVGDFAQLPLDDASFDCVYADNTLEHSFDVDAVLREILRVLRPGGVLVAAFPLDGLNPNANCPNHNWKTTAQQALLRVRRGGFVEVTGNAVDAVTTFGSDPFPPALDQMFYLSARRPPSGPAPI